MPDQNANSVDAEMEVDYDEEAAFLKSEDKEHATSTTTSSRDNKRAKYESSSSSDTILSSRLSAQRSSWPWITSTIILAIISSISIILNVTSYRSGSDSVWCNGIRPSDLEDARNVIEYEERLYTGALVYDPDTKNVKRLLNAEQQYFGKPSVELNDEWEKLMKGEFPIMTEAESTHYTTLDPSLRPLPMDHKIHFEPDVFHNLHCLNAIRLEVSKSLYPNTTDPSLLEHNHNHHIRPDPITLTQQWKEQHMEHCMDRIMQSLMCHADMTPSPLYWWDGFSIALGMTGNRTCRKFEPIRKWMTERNVNGTAMDGL